MFCSAQQAEGADARVAEKLTASEDVMLLDFETDETLAGNNTSHQASVVRVKDTPEGGGEFAAKTVADSAAGAGNFFGTGFRFPRTDQTYGDFELTLETNPDYPIDTGIMVRGHKLGTVGYQVLVDTVSFRQLREKNAVKMTSNRSKPCCSTITASRGLMKKPLIV